MVNEFKKETGAQLMEYAIGAVILVAVFVVAGVVIQDSGKTRGDEAMKIHQDAVPCGTDLTGDECL